MTPIGLKRARGCLSFRFVRCSPFRSQPFSVFTAFSFTFPFRASILENAGTRRRAQKTALAQTKSYTTAKSKMRPAARPSKQAIFSRETTRSLLSRRQESIGEPKKTHTHKHCVKKQSRKCERSRMGGSQLGQRLTATTAMSRDFL